MKYTRALALTTLIAFATSTMGCGYILYPERRGNAGGTIDGGTLVMDLLWLLPGIVPGVVFLIVDFSSGAMYVGGRVAIRATPNGDVAVKLNDSKAARTLELRLVAEKGNRVIDHKLADVGPTIHNESVQLHGGVAVAKHEKVFLQVVDPARPTTQLQVPVEVL
jgi:hypothetical protein